MILYKYLPPERLDILESFAIRVSPPIALNDPQESLLLLAGLERPRDTIDGFKADGAVRQVFLRYRAEPHETIWHAAHNHFDRDEIERTMDFVIRRELLEAIDAQPSTSITAEWIDSWRASSNERLQARLHDALALQLAERIVAGRLVDVVRDVAGVGLTEDDHLVGVLCLSSAWDSAPMWSHYSADHSGFCIGFESSDPFLGNFLFGMTTGPVAVEYVSDPLVVNALEFFERQRLRYFRKELAWSYEHEYRVLKWLPDANQVLDVKPWPIHLFRFPPKAIREVILGYAMQRDVQERAVTYQASKDLQPAVFFRTEVRKDGYGLSRVSA
jgi:hypothetical protein